jgi:hypothetical protein
MRSRLLRLASLLIALAGTAAPGAIAQTAFDLRDVGRATVPLDAGWQFKTGDDPAWASPAFNDSRWQPIEVGRAWEGQGHLNYTGFGWYRLHLSVPQSLPANSSANWTLGLLLTNLDDAAEVYWNGRLVGHFGQVAPHPEWFYRPAPVIIPLGAPRSGVLAVRVWKAPHLFLSSPDEGGLSAIPMAGSVEALQGLADHRAYNYLNRRVFSIAENSVSVLVGLLALIAWARDRRRRMLGWLALAMLFPLYSLLINDFPWPIPFTLFYSTIGLMVVVNDVSVWFLLLYLLGLDGNVRLVRWARIIALSALALSSFDDIAVWLDWTRLFPRFFLFADVVSTVPVELMELFVVVICLAALRKRLGAARWMLASSGLLLNLYQAVTDISGLGIRWTHWTIYRSLAAPLIHFGAISLNLSALINLFFLISIFYVAWRSSTEQNRRHSLLEQEMLSVQELQQVIVPEALPALPGYSVTSAYRPAQEVGGDFFQLIALPGDQAMLVIGDVSGKGLPAAMAVALTVGAIRSTVEVNDDPAAVLAALNRRLHGRLRGGFATCLAMRLDAAGKCLIANAGHLPPFLNGREVDLPPALPLGLVEDLDVESMELQLAAGDRLTLYTDGLLEARNAAGELFGFKRIGDFLAYPRNAAEVADAAQRFGQEDDITVLTLTVTPA